MRLALACAVIGCLVWALSASAGGTIFPPPDDPHIYYQPKIIVCHESRVVPSTPTHGIGSTITCQSYGVVAG